jgi:prepilin-type N-terminal cleavage/methylation domain-containing protein
MAPMFIRSRPKTDPDEREPAMKKSWAGKNGFTLAELLMVIVILGILGAIAMPRFFPQKEKALVAEAINMMGAIRQGELAYQLENDKFQSLTTGDTTNWLKVGLESPNSNNKRCFNYTVTVNGTLGTITATRHTCDKGDNSKVGETITLDIEDGTWGGTHPNRPS